MNREKWLAIRNTPRKLKRERFVYVATDYRWVPVNPMNPAGPSQFVKCSLGVPYRRGQ